MVYHRKLDIGEKEIMNKKILLDMDGVLCDTVGGVIKKLKPDYCIGNWTKGEYNISKELELGDFWEGLNYMFWTMLEPTKEFDIIIEAMLPYIKDMYIVTSLVTSQADAKLSWLQIHMPTCFDVVKQTIICNDKSMLSNPDYLLIDDCDDNIDNFDGPKYLVPRPWNTGTGVFDIKWVLKGFIDG